jgi:hypothetical protein
VWEKCLHDSTTAAFKSELHLELLTGSNRLAKATDMPKKYVNTFAFNEESPNKTVMTFSPSRENVGSWPTRADAKNDCLRFDMWDIVITLPDGVRHVCKGFNVEERAPGEFVAFYETP